MSTTNERQRSPELKGRKYCVFFRVECFVIMAHENFSVVFRLFRLRRANGAESGFFCCRSRFLRHHKVATYMYVHICAAPLRSIFVGVWCWRMCTWYMVACVVVVFVCVCGCNMDFIVCLSLCLRSESMFDINTRSVVLAHVLGLLS